MKTFHLEGYGTIHYIREYRRILDATLPVQRTGGKGYEIPLLAFLRWHLARSPPADPQAPLVLKLAFDNATVTSGKRVPQELGGFHLLQPGDSLSATKSPSSCHVWVVYIGGESEEELRSELMATIEVPCCYAWCLNMI